MAQTLQLRPYQNDAAGFLYERDRAMILAPVGAGKTAITLSAMQWMLDDGHVKRWLVVAPKRVCTDVWQWKHPSGLTLRPRWLSVRPRSAQPQSKAAPV